MKKYLVTLNYDKIISKEQAMKNLKEYLTVADFTGIITEDYHGNKKFHHHFLVGEENLPIKEWKYGKTEIIATADVNWKD